MIFLMVSGGSGMVLTDTRIPNAKPESKAYKISDANRVLTGHSTNVFTTTESLPFPREVGVEIRDEMDRGAADHPTLLTLCRCYIDVRPTAFAIGLNQIMSQ